MKQPKTQPKRELLEFEINPDIVDDGFTQSETTLWDNCGEAWYLRYNMMLSKKNQFSWALTYGSWIHDALEGFYKSGGKLKQWNPKVDLSLLKKLKQDEMESYWKAVGQAQVDVYFNHYKNDFKHFDINPKLVETIIETEYQGVRLKGMVDLPVKLDGGYYIMDHKTTSRIDKKVLMGWDFRFQFMFYVWLAKRQWPDLKIKGFIPNAIKKPEIKLKVNESHFEFAERVRMDMRDRCELYFWRDTCIIKKDDMDHFEREILQPKIDRLKFMLDTKVPDKYKAAIVRNKNTDHCLRYGQPCEFLPLCQHGFAIEGFQYKRREVKHEELDAE